MFYRGGRLRRERSRIPTLPQMDASPRGESSPGRDKNSTPITSHTPTTPVDPSPQVESSPRRDTSPTSIATSIPPILEPIVQRNRQRTATHDIGPPTPPERPEGETRPEFWPVGVAQFFPVISFIIGRIVRKNVNGPWETYSDFPKERKELMFRELQASEIGHLPDRPTLFLYTHQRSNGTFVVARASNIAAALDQRRAQISMQSSQDSTSSNAQPPINEDVLYLDVVGIKKGHSVDGTGSYGVSVPSLQSRAPPQSISTQPSVESVGKEQAFEAMQKEVEELRTRMLQHDMSIIAVQADVTAMQTDVTAIRSEVTSFHYTVTNIRRDMRDMRDDVRLIIQVMQNQRP